ncbi:DNA recombination and repair protein (nucleomorph) [Bigelowiella natans]|uniref:DNA recombination and repair protein n=1 Tax=Bigelowiella natans TaxID=227086 RepID=Q3LW29_BIGNA|nr:DNA recombination and repair protein [Bigelowiella natans]ABA27336.1 DNA recombination and repair protein [Bigelowiella natans]|mmetsp:Transcript_12982/g.15387  ORF Transcript_12982/g.15387 Transcript_12982/m.15387 type:complete len:332 (-) Transcript_12982:69-1064(-)
MINNSCHKASKRNIGLMELQKLGISDLDIQKLIDNGIFTINSLAKASKKELYSIKGLNDRKAEKILSLAKKRVPVGFSTLKNYLKTKKQQFHISTLNKTIDNLLEGGIESSSVTEIFGESKTGKTQFCHILCVSAMVDNYSFVQTKKVIYIDTEGNFRPERLIEISEKFKINFDFLINNVFYARAFNTEHQFQLLVAAASITAFSNVALIIVDSCTALLRTEYVGRGELFLRQTLLGKFLRNIQRLGEECNIAILLTNQVVTSNLDGMTFSAASNLKPIGGHIMAHYTNTRIWLKKRTSQYNVMKVISSSKLSEKEVKFIIQNTGLRVVSE